MARTITGGSRRPPSSRPPSKVPPFSVDIATTRPMDRVWLDSNPTSPKYRVIVSNYNGEDWPEPTRRAFEDYVKNGGGFVAVHAADNAFPQWAEYNRMIAVGGWGGRNDQSGPIAPLARRSGGQGPPRGAGTHGQFFSFVVETRMPAIPSPRVCPEMAARPRRALLYPVWAGRKRDRPGDGPVGRYPRAGTDVDGDPLWSRPRLPHDARPQRRVNAGRRFSSLHSTAGPNGPPSAGSLRGSEEFPCRRQGEPLVVPVLEIALGHLLAILHRGVRHWPQMTVWPLSSRTAENESKWDLDLPHQFSFDAIFPGCMGEFSATRKWPLEICRAFRRQL